MFSFCVTNIFAFSYFAVHYPTGPLNNLFGSVRGMDSHVHFHFHGQSSPFSDESAPEQYALIHARDQHTLWSILSTAALERSNQAMFQKPTFMFGDAAPCTNQQLLVREDQWIFKIREEKYYLPASKRHFPLSFFRTVTTTRMMEWTVTHNTDSTYVGILTSHVYSLSGPPRLVIGLHPDLVSKDVPAGKYPVMGRTFLN